MRKMFIYALSFWRSHNKIGGSNLKLVWSFERAIGIVVLMHYRHVRDSFRMKGFSLRIGQALSFRIILFVLHLLAQNSILKNDSS